MKKIALAALSVLVFAIVLSRIIIVTTDEECAHRLAPLVGEINAKFSEQVQTDINKCLMDEHRTTRLFISSRGGDINIALALYAILKSSPGAKNLVTVAAGQVASSAVIIFLAGEHREMSCNSYLMIHNHEFYFKEVRMGKHKLAEITALYNKLRDAQIGVIVHSTGLSNEKVVALLERSATITAQEAVQLGFAHKVTGKCE